MIEQRTTHYLAAVDEALPDFVAMLYLVGSVALGAWEPARSDIDLVIFTSRIPTDTDLVGLRAVHGALSAPPHLDGPYLSPGHSWPADTQTVPFVMDGEFHTDRPCGALNPVLWLTLKRYGIAVRGPAVSDLGVSVDLDALRSYNLLNLRTYWQGQAAAIRSYTANLDPTAEIDSNYLAWVVLGPARLHCTLATNDIISKSTAGEYVMTHFSEYAPLAERAVRWRKGRDETFIARDLDAAASLTDLIAVDAWNRWGG